MTNGRLFSEDEVRAMLLVAHIQGWRMRYHGTAAPTSDELFGSVRAAIDAGGPIQAPEAHAFVPFPAERYRSCVRCGRMREHPIHAEESPQPEADDRDTRPGTATGAEKK